MDYNLNMEQYAKCARQAAAEGCVLLKNDNDTLPLHKGDKVAVFGRCALHYYKSGLGSGGLVNTRYVVSILDALKSNEDILVHDKLLQCYEAWSKENPVDEGHGWGTVPWSQEEMPVTEEVLEIAKDATVAIVIVGRTAGEDQDNKNELGSYLLTQTERDMIAGVCSAFERTVVLLNVSNIIDMKWVNEYNPSAVMYVWQGGQEGGNGVVDVLMGRISPCGKLTDTIAYDINDYPSTSNFGDKYKNIYAEDIYVGYRYFETFAKEKVIYPFGFGLSYTEFDISAGIKEVTEDKVLVSVNVKNVGNCAGKEVVQVYVEAPQGVLGKPKRVLAGFAKSTNLEPLQSETMEIECHKTYFASYDDSGATNHKSCYVLESGKYNVYVGSDVRSAVHCGMWEQQLQVIEQLQEACAAVEKFERLRPIVYEDGKIVPGKEAVPTSSTNPKERIDNMRGDEIPYSGDCGFILADVYDKKISLDKFIAQLSDEDLMCIFRGEGMCSPKVTPGTAGAFGGLTKQLDKFGIPAICCADGPSGVRMDCGAKAFSLPNGTALGCSFNTELVEKLFEHMGKEIRKNKVDTLLGPGINIHRSPLNGRNFEYISEDPLLTGKIGAVQLIGMHKSDVAGTIKHYAANNQEQDRTTVGAVVSERALREIYLKGYEICVKEGNARSIMTSYNPVNGIWAAGNFDLCTTILRKEWGYKGIVMTDWWATANWDGEQAEKENRAPMVRAQNDIYMCCADTTADINFDNVKESLENGDITRYDLQRNAANILNFILQSPALLRKMGRFEETYNTDSNEDGAGVVNMPYYEVDKETSGLIINKERINVTDGEINFGISIPEPGEYSVGVTVSSKLSELAQLPLTLYIDNLYRTTCSFRGSEGKTQDAILVREEIKGKDHYVKLVLSGNGLEIEKIYIQKEARP